MIEGIVISIVVAYALGWAILKVLYWLDERSAKRIEAARHVRHLIKYGRVKSREEISEEAAANVLHGWD